MFIIIFERNKSFGNFLSLWSISWNFGKNKSVQTFAGSVKCISETFKGISLFSYSLGLLNNPQKFWKEQLCSKNYLGVGGWVGVEVQRDVSISWQSTIPGRENGVQFLVMFLLFERLWSSFQFGVIVSYSHCFELGCDLVRVEFCILP